MQKVIIILLASILCAGTAAPCYCQQAEEQRAIKEVDGTIYDMDWAGSKMVVRWVGASGSSYNELVLNVPDDAVIRKGEKVIETSELEIADMVTVRYYENPDGTGTLISLEDTTSSP